MKAIIHVLTICSAVIASGMSVKAQAPDYLNRPMPERWEYTTDVQQTLPSDDKWWTLFEDAPLDTLISTVIDNNYNLRTAYHRMEIARQTISQAAAQYYPSFAASAGYTNSRSAGAIRNSDTPSSNSSYFSLGVDMNWEIDLFGKISSQVKNKKALYNASKADYTATMVSLTAQAATYYINLRTLQNKLAIAREHIESQGKVVKITEARYEAGLVSKLDVAQAKTIYCSTEVTIPQLEYSIRETINAIAILMGVYPSEVPASITEPRQQPAYTHLVATGVPMNLLRRRPDIMEAEYQLAAYAAQLGIAKKDFLPTLSLQGSVGVAAHKMGDMFKKNSFEYSIAPTLSWTMFDGFARKYAVAEAKEQMQIGIDNYNLTVMTAVQEVDNALKAYFTTLETIDRYVEGFGYSKEAFDLSIDQYTQGLSPFTNVVNAQIDWLNYATSMAEARGNALQALISLYKALGGSPTE